VIAEHAIGGVKRLRALSNTYRNKKEKFDDTIMNIGCGVWNYHLKWHNTEIKKGRYKIMGIPQHV